MKRAIGCAPFDLVYGIHARLPQNNLLEMYKFVQLYDDDIDDEMQLRMEDLIRLDETRRESVARNAKLQLQVKNLYDKKTVDRKFEPSDLVLVWNAKLEDKGKHGKFDPIWLGSYLIHDKWGQDSYIIKDFNGDIQELPVHGLFLKQYFI